MNKRKLTKKINRKHALGYDREGVLMEYLTRREKAVIYGFVILGGAILTALIAVFFMI